ncbi:MAG: WD40 repeat domain-containing protein, partial [Flammeovirgaceae bacterium]
SLVNSISSASNYFPLYAQFTNDEKFILVNTRESISVVNVHKGNTVRTFARWTKGSINSAAFDAAGKSIFASSYSSWPDKKWRMEDGKVSFINTTFPKDLTYNFQKYSPKQRYVATSTLNTTTVSLWDTETGKLISNLEGHSYFPTQVVFSSNEKYLLTGSSGDFATKLWETKTGKLVANLVSGPAMATPLFSKQGG